MLKLLLIPMMIKALLATRQPLLCAVIYGAALFTNGLIFDLGLGADPGKVALSLAISTGVAFAVFYALKETEDMGALYWVALVLGVALMIMF